MHVLFKKIGTFVTSMAVKHSKVAAAWPSPLEVRLGNIHDNRDTIFIIIFDQSMEGIDRVSLNGPI